jgi:hypothetical protein
MQYQQIVDWVLRIIRLDLTPFEEARRDNAATVPIVVLVGILSFLSGLGSFLWVVINVEGGDTGDIFVESFLLGSILQFLLWFLWVFVAYLLLTQVFRAAADLSQMVRVMGLAFVPVALAAVMFVPAIDFTIGLVSLVAAVLLVQIALQEPTNASQQQTMLANLAGFIVLAAVLNLVVTESNRYAPGFFVLDFSKDAYLNLQDEAAGFFGR